MATNIRKCIACGFSFPYSQSFCPSCHIWHYGNGNLTPLMCKLIIENCLNGMEDKLPVEEIVIELLEISRRLIIRANLKRFSKDKENLTACLANDQCRVMELCKDISKEKSTELIIARR